MLESLGRLAQQLGALFITFATLSKTWQKTIIAHPWAAIAAGVALVVLGRLAQAAAQSLVSDRTGGSGREGGRYAEGGLVRGPGGPTDDAVPARLSAGEYVMPARVVTPRNLDVFEAIRAGEDPLSAVTRHMAAVQRPLADLSRPALSGAPLPGGAPGGAPGGGTVFGPDLDRLAALLVAAQEAGSGRVAEAVARHVGGLHLESRVTGDDLLTTLRNAEIGRRRWDPNAP